MTFISYAILLPELFGLYFCQQSFRWDILPTIEITSGYVKGKLMNIELYNNSFVGVQSYLGIPYAEPPLNDHRFKPPVYKSRWNHVLEAFKPPPMCPQDSLSLNQKLGYTMNEDCLYLNVWAPNARSGIELKPVIFYIHGGSYQYGDSNMWLPYMVVQRDIVLVSANYRLGILGFFTTGDEEGVSNLGMRDQLMALEWVRTNIRVFGGDPNRITLMGQSAGASAAGLHLLSPLSGARNLFQSIISMSGTPISPWGYHANPLRSISISRYVANRLGCLPLPASLTSIPLPKPLTAFLKMHQDIEFLVYGEIDYRNLVLTSEAYQSGRSYSPSGNGDRRKQRAAENARMMHCMRHRSVQEILAAGEVQIGNRLLLNRHLSMTLAWAPVVDGSFYFPLTPDGSSYLKPFLPIDPVDVLISSPASYPKIPILMGLNKDEESTVIIPDYSPLLNWAIDYKANFTASTTSHSYEPPDNFVSAVRDFLYAQNVSRPEGPIIAHLAQTIWSSNNNPLIGSASQIHSLTQTAQIMARNNDILTKLFSSVYFPGHSLHNLTLLKMAYVQMTTDNQFVAPLDKFSKTYVAQGGKIYQYLFDYRPEMTLLERWQGVGHGTDLPFMFGTPFLNHQLWPINHIQSFVSNFTETDRAVSLVMLTALENFVKYKNPAPPVAFDSHINVGGRVYQLFHKRKRRQTTSTHALTYPFANIRWPPHQSADYSYLHVFSTTNLTNRFPFPQDNLKYDYSLKIGNNYRGQFMGLWNIFVPSLLTPKENLNDGFANWPSFASLGGHLSFPGQFNSFVGRGDSYDTQYEIISRRRYAGLIACIAFLLSVILLLGAFLISVYVIPRYFREKKRKKRCMGDANASFLTSSGANISFNKHGLNSTTDSIHMINLTNAQTNLDTQTRDHLHYITKEGSIDAKTMPKNGNRRSGQRNASIECDCAIDDEEDDDRITSISDVMVARRS